MTSPDHPGALELELLLVNEASAETAGHVARCLVCQRRLRALQIDNRQFADTHDEEAFLRHVADASGRPARIRRRWPMGIAAGLAAGFAATGLLGVAVQDSGPDDLQTKGDKGSLRVVRDREGQQTFGCRRLAVQVEDRIRFIVTGPSGATAMVVARPASQSAERGEDVLATVTLDGTDQLVPPTSFAVPGDFEPTTVVLQINGQEAVRCTLWPSE